MVAATIAAIGAVTAGAGLAMSVRGANKAEKANKAIASENAKLSKEVTAISIKQEALRKQQLEMEALNAKRQVIRNAQLARATSLARASAQGGMTSTSYMGAQAQITSQAADQQNTIFENLTRGRTQFSLNEDLLKAQNASAQKTGQFNSQLASASTMIDFGKSLYTLGGSITNSSEKAANVVNSLFPRY